MELKLAQLAMAIGAVLHENRSKLPTSDGDICLINSVATLQNARQGQLAFLAHSRYRKHLASTQASAVILTAAELAACPVAALVVDQPLLAYARAATLLYPAAVAVAGIHHSACIDPLSRIHASASVGPYCVIEAGAEIAAYVQIGAGCLIGAQTRLGEYSRVMSRVSIHAGTVIGTRAVIHAGAVIGSDGFGFANDRGVWVKILQLGHVRIGDDVDIGANTTIDCGALEDTVIEDGVKLDNQIQVAHNVHIGAHTAIAGCVGIAGSARIGKRCTLGGGVGVAGHLEIVDDVHITGMTLVSKSILKPGVYSSGVPAQENHLWNKNYARLCRLDEMAHTLRGLQK